jgi:hypothetical protein
VLNYVDRQAFSIPIAVIWWSVAGMAVPAFRLFSGLEPDATRMQRHFVAMGHPR